MISKLLFGLLVILSISSVVHSIHRRHSHERKHFDRFRSSVCTRTFNDPCYSTKECCNNLECSKGFPRTCQCPAGFTWSATFMKCHKCPPGWVFFKDNCFNISTSYNTWLGAEAACDAIDGNLAAFDSLVIVDEIYQFTQLFSLTGTYHIGARSLFVPSNWTWPDGTCIPGAGPWWPDCYEPFNTDGTPKFLGTGCAMINGTHMIDISCSSTITNYICELKSNRNVLLPQYNHPSSFQKCYGNEKWSNILQRCVECPNKWTLLDDGCFFVSDTARTWDQADSYCRANRAQLFTTTSALIIDVLASLFQVNNLNVENYWIGAQFVNSSFRWTDGRALPDNGPMWADCGYPLADTTANCVATFGFSLENYACNIAHKFICRFNSTLPRIY